MLSLQPSVSRLKSLDDATSRYQDQLGTALTYLEDRGITQEAAEAGRLGVVTSPVSGHERYTGRLAIPYLTFAGVVALKFRCLQYHDCKTSGCVKYLALDGSTPRLYGVFALHLQSPVVAICEGELDALLITQRLGVPAVGAPGAAQWATHWDRLFEGYTRVLLIGDGDEAGRAMQKKLAGQLPQAAPVWLPQGMDVTDVFVKEGSQWLLDRMGVTPVSLLT